MSNLSNKNGIQAGEEKNSDFQNVNDIKQETCIEQEDLNVNNIETSCETERDDVGVEGVNYRVNKIRMRGQKKQTKFAPIRLAENNNETGNNRIGQVKIKVLSDLTISKTEPPKNYKKELFDALRKKRPRKDEPEETNRKKTCLASTKPKAATTILISSLLDQINETNQPVKETTTSTISQVRKRGRPKKSGSPIRVKKETNHNVTCAVCKLEMLSTSWPFHKHRYHNNLTWAVGEKPIDLNNQTTVMAVLHGLYKQKKPFYCEICGGIKKSVMGYLSHKSTCNKTEKEIEDMKITCEICGRSMMSVSMSVHLKQVHEKKEYTELDQMFVEEPAETPSKRKAAKKAKDLLDLIKENGQITMPTRKKATNLNRIILTDFNFGVNKWMKSSFNKELDTNKQVSCRFEGCDYQTDAVSELLSHIAKCDQKPLKNFTCKFCVVPYKSYEECAQHVKQLHVKEKHSENEYSDSDSESGSNDELLLDNKKKLRKSVVPGQKKYQTFLVPFLKKFKSLNKNRKVLYLPAYNWMLKFAKKNLNETNIFPDILVAKQNWHQIPPSDIRMYLPRIKISIETNRIESFQNPLSLNYVSWKRYKLFESELHVNGNSTVFCGGPVSCLAWVPTPLDKTVDQIIAVSVCLEPDKDYVLMRRYNDKGLLQFWNFGPLDLKSSSSYNPKLEFCIGHDYGLVYCLEWCPSGCYTPNQLGLLAMACSDSFVYVYSICQPNTLKGKMFKTKPAFKLDLNTLDELNLGEQKYHATRVSWSKTRGHKYVAVGYSNGVVAMFDLSSVGTTETSEKHDGVPVLIPYLTFTAHWHAITALGLHHLNGGRRWLMTGSFDKLNKFWDLNNPVEPIVCHKKYEITEGVWPCNWLGGATTQDDAAITIINATTYGQARDVGANPTTLLYANSRINSLTFSDWGNIFVQGTTMGEIHASYPNQLFQNIDLEKSLKLKKFAIGYTSLIEKELSIAERLQEEKQKIEALKNQLPKQYLSDLVKKITYSNVNPHYYKAEPRNYRESDERYGLVFADLKLESMKEITTHLENISFKSENLSLCKPNMYPIQSVNKVAFNPNKQSFLYVASGYQAGFLRISFLRLFSTQLSL